MNNYDNNDQNQEDSSDQKNNNDEIKNQDEHKVDSPEKSSEESPELERETPGVTSSVTFYRESVTTDSGSTLDEKKGAEKKFREYIPHIVLFILAVLGCYIFLKLYDTAFPLVTINFKVNRETAQKIAVQYLEKLGYSTTGYESTVIFSMYGSTKEFLEKELPQKEANQLMGKIIPVWYWKVRFFKYREKKEYTVFVEPTGKIIYFERVISDDEPDGTLSMNDGETKARFFLMKQGVNTDKLEIVDRIGKPLKNRTDRTFTFQDKEINIKEARLYYKVHFQGEKPGYYATYLHIPQKILLAWKDEDKKGELLVNIANFLVFIMLLGLVVYINTHGIPFRWKFAAIITGALVLVTLLEQVNSLSLIESGYSTNMDKGNFWTGVWVSIIVMTVLYGVIGFFTTSLGTSLQDGSRRKENLVMLLGGHKIPLNIFIGYAVAFIILGYDVIFYLAGKYVGVWTPLDISYDNILSTPLPWVNALFIGFSAAVLEEIFFRMCAINFLEKWMDSVKFFKKFRLNRILPLVIPAVLWAALHCNYPQEPFYIRAVELTFVGIFLGWIYKKYGILSTIVSHYCLNAVYGSALLIKSNNPYFVISGYVTVSLMLIPAVAAFIMRDKVAKIEKDALEEDRRIREAEAAKPEVLRTGKSVVIPRGKMDDSVSYTKLEQPKGIFPIKFSFQFKIIMIILALLGIVSSLLIKSPKLGSEEKFSINPFQAKTIARKFLEEMEVDLTDSVFGVQAMEYPEPEEMRYIARQLGIKAASKHFKKYLPGQVWVVDVNFDKRKESYRVVLHSNGKIFTYYHSVTEDWGKTKLSKEEAKEKALKYLKNFKGNFEFSDFQEKSRNNRTDYTFIFREKSGDVGDAVLSAKILVKGNETQWFQKYFEIPGSFKRKQEERGIKDTVSLVVMAVTGLGFFIWTIIYSIKRKLAGEMDLKFAIKFALVVAISAIIQRINQVGDIWNDIPFNESFSSIIISWCINTILLPISLGLFTLYIFTLLESLYRDLFPGRTPFRLWLEATMRKGFRTSYIRWGVLCSYGLVLFSMIPLLPLLLNDKQLTYLNVYTLWAEFPPGISFIPAIRIITSSIAYGIPFLGITALFILFLKKIFDRDILVIIAILILFTSSVAGMVQGNNLSIYLITGVVFLIKITAVFLFIRYFFRDNLYAYLLFPIIARILAGAFILLFAGTTFFMLNGIALLVILFIPVVIALLPLDENRETDVVS